jgi:hypothetical protein
LKEREGEGGKERERLPLSYNIFLSVITCLLGVVNTFDFSWRLGILL